MPHPVKRFRRRFGFPVRKTEPNRVQKFLAMKPSLKVEGALLATCRQLIADGVDHDEIACALFRIGGGYVKASGLPLDPHFIITE